MTRPRSAFGLAFLLWALSVFAARCSVASVAAVPLCDALEAIQSGEERDVTVSGIYREGPESSILYSANCTRNVQPVTWVEFSPDWVGRPYLREATKAGAANVVVSGILYGPGRLSHRVEELGVGELQVFRGNRRFGHLNGFRTRLVIREVLRADPILPDLESTSVHFWSPSISDRLPEVLSGSVPVYPKLARVVGLTGKVELEVLVQNGVVSEVKVKSGHRVLADEAVKTVKTWRFHDGAAAAIETTFVFDLESRLLAANQNPRIELYLPSLVKITGAIDKW